MDTISSFNIYRFRGEVLVEIFGTGSDGEVAVRTVEFDVFDGNQLVPRAIIRDIDDQLITKALEADGYTVCDPADEPDVAGVA